MRRRIVGALVTAAALVAFHPLQVQEESVQPEDTIRKEGSELVSVALVDTVDGDTIKVRINGKVETVRYLLVDTAESKKPGTCVQPYAKEAFLRNDELVKSGSLTVEFEPENIRDSYGRLLAYVYVDGKSVQEALLKDGLARVAYIMKPPYKYLTLYKNDENLAKSNRLNIWSKPGLVTKWGFNGCEQ